MATGAAFRRIEQEFRRLNDQLTAGQITRDQHDSALKELMVQDEQGRYWTIGANSGKWYVNDGARWVEAAPPGEAAEKSTPSQAPVPPLSPSPPAVPFSPAPVKPPMATTTPVRPFTPPRSNSRKWIIAIIVAVLVLCLCLCLACAVVGLFNQPFSSPVILPTVPRPQ